MTEPTFMLKARLDAQNGTSLSLNTDPYYRVIPEKDSSTGSFIAGKLLGGLTCKVTDIVSDTLVSITHDESLDIDNDSDTKGQPLVKFNMQLIKNEHSFVALDDQVGTIVLKPAMGSNTSIDKSAYSNTSIAKDDRHAVWISCKDDQGQIVSVPLILPNRLMIVYKTKVSNGITSLIRNPLLGAQDPFEWDGFINLNDVVQCKPATTFMRNTSDGSVSGLVRYPNTSLIGMARPVNRVPSGGIAWFRKNPTKTGQRPITIAQLGAYTSLEDIIASGAHVTMQNCFDMMTKVTLSNDGYSLIYTHYTAPTQFMDPWDFRSEIDAYFGSSPPAGFGSLYQAHVEGGGILTGIACSDLAAYVRGFDKTKYQPNQTLWADIIKNEIHFHEEEFKGANKVSFVLTTLGVMAIKNAINTVTYQTLELNPSTLSLQLKFYPIPAAALAEPYDYSHILIDGLNLFYVEMIPTNVTSVEFPRALVALSTFKMKISNSNNTRLIESGECVAYPYATTIVSASNKCEKISNPHSTRPITSISRALLESSKLTGGVVDHSILTQNISSICSPVVSSALVFSMARSICVQLNRMFAFGGLHPTQKIYVPLHICKCEILTTRRRNNLIVHFGQPRVVANANPTTPIEYDRIATISLDIDICLDVSTKDISQDNPEKPNLVLTPYNTTDLDMISEFLTQPNVAILLGSLGRSPKPYTQQFTQKRFPFCRDDLILSILAHGYYKNDFQLVSRLRADPNPYLPFSSTEFHLDHLSMTIGGVQSEDDAISHLRFLDTDPINQDNPMLTNDGNRIPILSPPPIRSVMSSNSPYVQSIPIIYYQPSIWSNTQGYNASVFVTSPLDNKIYMAKIDILANVAELDPSVTPGKWLLVNVKVVEGFFIAPQIMIDDDPEPEMVSEEPLSESANVNTDKFIKAVRFVKDKISELSCPLSAVTVAGNTPVCVNTFWVSDMLNNKFFNERLSNGQKSLSVVLFPALARIVPTETISDAVDPLLSENVGQYMTTRSSEYYTSLMNKWRANHPDRPIVLDNDFDTSVISVVERHDIIKQTEKMYIKNNTTGEKLYVEEPLRYALVLRFKRKTITNKSNEFVLTKIDPLFSVSDFENPPSQQSTDIKFTDLDSDIRMAYPVEDDSPHALAVRMHLSVLRDAMDKWKNSDLLGNL